jgi:hypothetical protein
VADQIAKRDLTIFSPEPVMTIVFEVKVSLVARSSLEHLTESKFPVVLALLARWYNRQ